VILFIGHAFERKGFADAVAALAQSGSGAHLVVVGGGDPEEYRREAEALGVGGRVHFAGAVDSPEDYYAAADLLVLPTRSDPWGIPVIEAMAAGVPVVTTEAGRRVRLRGCGRGRRSRRPAPLAGTPRPRDRRAPGRPGPEARDGRAREGRGGTFDIASVVDATLAVYEHALAEKRA
jgi:Glycosyl transferases group 1